MDRGCNDGCISILVSRGMVTELEVVEGMLFDRGFLSLYIVSDNEKQE